MIVSKKFIKMSKKELIIFFTNLCINIIFRFSYIFTRMKPYSFKIAKVNRGISK